MIFIVFIVVPTFRYVKAKLWVYIDPIKFNLSHVMIIGGSDGLGKELAKEVFRRGALVTIIGRNEDKLR